MATPTPDQLVAFFTALTQLRTVFGTVVITFSGHNSMPKVFVYWPGDNTQLIDTAEAASDSPDDLTAAVNGLFVKHQAEGQLRAQLASLKQQQAEIEQQLAK